jgi:glycosyltransferase involved in cell wall biosynthesis
MIFKKNFKNRPEKSGENYILKKLPTDDNRQVVIISSGFDSISFRFLSEFIFIVRDIFKEKMELIIPHDPSSDIFFAGEKIKIHHIGDLSEKQKSCSNPFLILFNHVKIELKISYLLLKGNRSDIYLFFLSQSKILPLLILKFQNKKSVLMLGASLSELYRSRKNFGLKIFSIIEKADFILADTLIIYSPKLITEWQLEPHRHKILIAHEHFLDFDSFADTTPLSDRPNVIGYIGRLSPEKGVQHFVSSLSTILHAKNEIHILIGGDGPLKKDIIRAIKNENLNNRVKFSGWISHDDLPQYLNQLRLLVLPSYTEGLPNIMLEAMACGTPVLATPVGAIPDIIKDGETGFIMQNNSPECIAENVQRALNCSDLAVIANNGRQLVQNNYSFEKTVSEWKKIFETI